MSYDKLERIMEILEELSDIYPDIERVIINDSDSPDYIILTTDVFLKEMSDAFGVSEEFSDSMEEIYSSIPKKEKKRKLQ